MTIKEKINGRTCCVLLSGASLEILRRDISLFKTLDVCWCGINTFDIPQKHILDKISKQFDIILDISEVADPETYDKKRRFPRVMKYLFHYQGLYITTNKLISDMKKFDNKTTMGRIFEVKKDKIKHIKDYVDVNTIHNSLGAYLHMLTKCGAEKIYLFGCDGYQGEYIEHNAMMSYFCYLETIEDIKAGFHNKIHCAIASDTEAFNGSFEVSYLRYCMKHRLVPAEIYNVSPSAFITIFPRISLSTAQHSIEENQNELNR